MKTWPQEEERIQRSNYQQTKQTPPWKGNQPKTKKERKKKKLKPIDDGNNTGTDVETATSTIVEGNYGYDDNSGGEEDNAVDESMEKPSMLLQKRTRKKTCFDHSHRPRIVENGLVEPKMRSRPNNCVACDEVLTP